LFSTIAVRNINTHFTKSLQSWQLYLAQLRTTNFTLHKRKSQAKQTNAQAICQACRCEWAQHRVHWEKYEIKYGDPLCEKKKL